MSTGVLNEPVSALSLCWIIERKDGAGVALTSHDQVIRLNGTRFEPATGIEPSAIVKGEAGEPPAECGGALTSMALTEADLMSGRWDRAKTGLLAVDWSDPGNAPVGLSCGELGEVNTGGNGFSAELLGSATKLQAPVAPITSPECRASLGDKKCRVDLAGRRRRLKVSSSNGPALTLAKELGEEFRLGSVRWISGENCGLSSMVVGVAGTKVILREVPYFPVRPGDTILFTEGCDKRIETCAKRFRNAVNFRGEPHLPGNDLLTRYPGN